jgi:ABC-type transporter Mla maintaining outer membrane lipid asymmetry permease subunit MlaE
MTLVLDLAVLTGLAFAAGLCGGWLAGRKTPEVRNVGFMSGLVSAAAALFAVWVLGWLRFP